jgi:hypothetical protein
LNRYPETPITGCPILVNYEFAKCQLLTRHATPSEPTARGMLSDNIHQAAHYLSQMPPNRTLLPNRRVAAIGAAPVTTR